MKSGLNDIKRTMLAIGGGANEFVVLARPLTSAWKAFRIVCEYGSDMIPADL